ncbi:MAG: glycosyltransferase [Candidatus Aenigmarchaeota archaeon]|nr:glycosyltransferase [Candidatus Aenigmarchaeota archaeon]
MKILLNGLSVSYPISGVGQYTLQLGKALSAVLGPGKVLWFGRDLSADGQSYLNGQGPNFKNYVQHMVKRGLGKIPGVRTPVHAWRNRKFRICVRTLKASLYHETNYVPFEFEEGLTVVSVCDLSFLRHPEWHPIDRVRYFKKYCLERLSRVEAVITISEFSRKELLDLPDVDPARIYVTPLGVNRSFRPGKKRMPGLPNRYILFLGNLEPRKNLPKLLAAYGSLPRGLRDRYPLVIAGAKVWHTNEFKKLLNCFPEKEKIILPGYVPQELLPDLYRGASLFVYPSLYEGFGLPVLEAMACGVPVVASKTTSLPEVVGDAGILVDPRDVNELREGMVNLLDDERLRDELSQKGLERAKLFTWEKCAQQTIAVYEKILAERR